MEVWEWECFEDVINHGHYEIDNAGPLHKPIKKFKISRDSKLQLTLDTIAAVDGSSLKQAALPGTVSNNHDYIELCNLNNKRAYIRGIQPHSHNIKHSIYEEESRLDEYSTFQGIEIKIGNENDGVYVIEWLENIDDRCFIWPDSIDDAIEKRTTKLFSRGEDSFEISGVGKSTGFSRCCIKSRVAEQEFYFVATPKLLKEQGTTGYILYKTIPSPEVRKKIRDCISFVIGRPIVYLGYTIFDKQWSLISTEAVSAYTIGGRVFEIVSLPPSPLGRKYENELNPETFTHMVNAIFENYEALNFGHLIWNYWQAICAPLTMAPVHFGALHEALQKCVQNNWGVKFKKTILDKPEWLNLEALLLAALDKFNSNDKAVNIFRSKIKNLNQLPQSLINEKYFNLIELELSDLEISAWKHRNNAAHGEVLKPEQVIDVIRETKILKVLLHRMLLKLTQANYQYYDYYTVNFPIRHINTPIT